MSPALAILATLAASLAHTPPQDASSGAVWLGPWHVLGPFDNLRGAEVGVEHGPEKLLRRMKAGAPWPALAETFPGRGKAKLAWSRVEPAPPAAGARPFDSGTLDLRILLDAHGAAGDNVAGYLYRTLECDAPQTVDVHCGSDDGLRLWLDGEVLVDKSVLRGLNAYDERLTLTLAPGLHHLLVKVTNAGGAWSFAMVEPRRATQDQIDRAIDRGVARLLELQQLDGSWAERRDEHPNGQTGLAVYTLIKCGLSPRHRALQQALLVMRSEPCEKTYAVACQVLAATAARDAGLMPWIEELTTRLLGWQRDNGGWSYPVGETDLSNTHLAVFSLRAAAQAGVEIPVSVWNDAASYTLRNQETRRKDSGGGFTYYVGHETGYTGSMTAAGLAILACAREALGTRMTPNLAAQVEPALEGGVGWLARHFTATKNPNKADWHYYWLYALERAAALLDLERIGAHDWYAEGADFLVGAQESDGDWGWEHDTCFALLFLRRATAQPVSQEARADARLFATPEGQGPIRLRVRLDTPSRLWIEAPSQPVESVEFLARFEQGEWRTIASAGKEGAAQHVFERPGRWELRAAARLAGGATLESPVLAVEHQEGLDPRLAAYATDAGRNRLATQKVEARASSALEPAANAADNKVWTRWLCQEADADPWLELEPKKPVESARILLSHARTTAAAQRYANPRPAAIELWINKEKSPRTVAIDPDPSVKTVIELVPPVAIARLKLRVTAVEGGTLGQGAVGFSEIELQGP